MLKTFDPNYIIICNARKGSIAHHARTEAKDSTQVMANLIPQGGLFGSGEQERSIPSWSLADSLRYSLAK